MSESLVTIKSIALLNVNWKSLMAVSSGDWPERSFLFVFEGDYKIKVCIAKRFLAD
jgi:hypothetical protein